MRLSRIQVNIVGKSILRWLFALVFLLTSTAAEAVCTRGVLSWVSLPEGGVANALYVSGDYAYVAYGDGGLQIVHLATDNPQVVGSFTTTAAARDVFVSGNYAYLTMDGLEIVNVSNKSAPALSKARFGGHLNGVHVAGNYAYLAGEQYSGNWAFMRIYDLSDPVNPTYVGDRKLESGQKACDIYVADGYAYLSTCSSGRLYVVDLGAVGAPLVDTLPAGCYSGNYSGQGVFAAGNYAYVAEAELHTYDVSNKSAISEVLTAGCSDVCTPSNCLGTAGGRGLFVRAGRAYTGVYNGLYIQNVSVPSAPSHVTTVATQGNVAVRDVAPWGNCFVVVTSSTLQILEACPPIIDADGDGIQDSDDQCSDTAPENEVDAFGCSSAQNIDKILELYAQLDLKGHEAVPGLPTNGPATNIASLVIGDGGEKIVTTFDGKVISIGRNKDGGIECGRYQGTLIEWLETLRKSSTAIYPGGRSYGDLFTNVDYGPIQTYWFAHQALVIYPKGTNWKTRGTVLDPWFIQNTKSYPVYGWGAHFPGVETDLVTWLLADESGYYTTGFPMYGTGYSDEIEAAVVAARIARRSQIEQQKQRLAADCPVNFHLVDNQSGNRIGYFEGEGFVNEFPGAFVTMGYISGNEDMMWYFGLPEGTYQMEGTGLGSGMFGLKTAYEDKGIFDYGTNPIVAAGTASLVVSVAQPAALMELPDGSRVAPLLIRRPVTILPFIPLLLHD